MAYVSPPTRNAGDLITAADWNQYIKANQEALSGLIAYVNGAALSGWTEFTTARGLFILGLVSGGTLATAVGTPLTDQQNISHTHSVSLNYHATEYLVGTLSVDQGKPISGTAAGQSAGSIGIPYIQLRCISKD